MDKKEFTKILFEKGKKKGLSEMEVYLQGGEEINIRVFKEEIDKYTIANEEGLSLRGLYNGKMGYSYTEKIDETSIDMLVEEVINNAKTIDSEDEEEILKGSNQYKEVNAYNEDLEKATLEDKIEFIKNLEKEAFKIDKRVCAVDYCLFGQETNLNSLINTKGLNLESKTNIAYIYISVMVKDGEDVKTAEKYIMSNDFSKFNYKKLASDAVKEAVSMLGAETINSGDYTVVLRNDVSASILEAFIPIFSAENVQKNLSLLKGKINNKIANEIITIIDNPFMADGAASSSFDGEGTATKYKKIVDKGVLKTYLHNSKTAKKDGIESTGNADKPSYKSPVIISPSNMYIENGNISLEEMVKGINNGLLIIDVQGLHAGLNTVSGDFSLSAYGYEIKDGAIIRPVNQITIASNYYDVLKNVEAVGNDLKFVFPSGRGYIGSPSIKIKKLSIAGK